jgi:monovalent cation/hydrogen antiporter
MQAAAIHQIEILIITLLLLVVGFGAIAKRLRTPYPILLVVAGLIVSLVPGLPHVSLNPDVVFLAILPPLLFSAGFATSWRDFRFHLITIFMLAFGLVGFTVFGVAFASQYVLPGFTWQSGLVLGAVVSTTDAIAATSIARRLGLSPKIIDVLEGESLVNDASGLLALEFAVGLMVSGKVPTFTDGMFRLVYLVAGGLVIGLLIGKLINLIEQLIDDAPIEITISILTPYGAYLAAESAHASGVLATVACGLYLGRKSARYFSSSVRIEAYAVWNTLTFILNGIVFILIGLQLPFILSQIQGLGLKELILTGLLFSAIVIILRLLWMFPGGTFAYFIRRKLLHQRVRRPTRKQIFVVGWTGMRGVVALAAAVSLPEKLANGDPFPHRNVILFLTFAVIFVTLVLQGLTLPTLIRKLGLSRPSGPSCEEEEARRIIIDAALERLQASRNEDGPEFAALYDDLAFHYQHRREALTATDNDEIPAVDKERYHVVARALRDVERATALNLRDTERINDEVLRKIQIELDLLEAREGTH